jgi:ABC-type multidrug transport system ATPase subunit
MEAALLTKRGLRVDVVGVSRVVRGGQTVLRDVTFAVEPGEVIAVVGASGAGKSSLLDAIAGVRAPSSGSVRFDGVDVRHRAVGHAIGYVPQDDVVHRELPLEATLRYAAQLRLPRGTTTAEVERAVSGALRSLELEERATVRVGSLSGGQRKRASIAAELLTGPRAMFLDEPTSGLDPATAVGLMRTLRNLAEQGTTVVLTTHSTEDLQHCDRIVFMASGGCLAFVGTPDEALAYFDVTRHSEIYERLTAGRCAQWSGPTAAEVDGLDIPVVVPAPRITPLSEWAVLARRNIDVLRRNRLTLAILAGSPVLVVAMFAMLFEPGAFDPSSPSPTAAVSIAYWMAFGAFFFGLTYGLLQICTEIAIVRRERLVGQRIGPYLAAKVAVLVPILFGVVVLMLVTLGALDRLPNLELDTYLQLTSTLMATAVAALALGLLASAAVTDPTQATLALPMLCFPAVLFSGAVLPVPTMAVGGRIMSLFVIARWGFEAVGHQLGVDGFVAEYGDSFAHSAAGRTAILIAFTAVLLFAAGRVLRSRTSA